MARSHESYISFVLREPNSSKPTPIIGVIRFNNTHLKVPTGFSIHPKFWDNEKYRVKRMIAASENVYINNHIIELEQALGSILPELKAKRVVITKDILRQRIEEHFQNQNPPVRPNEPALFSFINEFIEQSPQRINIQSGKNVEKRTIQKYQTVLKAIKKFSNTYNRPVDFEFIDLDFYDSFTSFLTNEEKLATNTIGKYIQTLKVFLNEASCRGINVKQDFRSRRFKVIKENSDSIFFNEDELQKLNKLDLTHNKRLEKVRDLFLVGCYTGLRFSDLSNIRPEYIQKDVIRLEQLKTIEKVVIPCHRIVKSMLLKYNNELPCNISNQKMNKYLKEVCELAEFNSIEQKSITKAGKRITQLKMKHEMVGTHTARRSFATNMYLMGVPTFTIMKITGHKTEKAFMSYIKLDKEQHANIISNLWDKKYEEQTKQ